MGLLDIIEQRESGGRNVPNYKYGPGFSASGHYQIIDETWRRWAKGAGIDVSAYPTAMSAPKEVQTAVANYGLQTEGTKPWEAMKGYTPPAGVLSATGDAPPPIHAKDRADLERLLVERYPELAVTSRDRDPEHNAAVGGAKGSQHLHGTAMDVSMKDMDPARREEIARYARDLGAKGFGYYPNSNSMHFDMRPGSEAFWGPNYSKSSLGQTPDWFQKLASEPGGSSATPSTGSPAGVLTAQGDAPAPLPPPTAAGGAAAFNTAFNSVQAASPSQTAPEAAQPAPQPQQSAPQMQASALQNVPPQSTAADLMSSLLARRRSAQATALPRPPGILRA